MPITHAAINSRDSVAPVSTAPAASNSGSLPGTPSGSVAAPSPISTASLTVKAVLISDAMRKHLGDERYSRYFFAPWAFNAGGWLEIPVSSPLLAQLCQKHFQPLICKAARDAASMPDLVVRFVVCSAEAGGYGDSNPNSRLATPSHTSSPAAAAAAAAAGLTPIVRSPVALPVGRNTGDAPSAAGPQQPAGRTGRSASRQHTGTAGAAAGAGKVASPGHSPPNAALRYKLDQLVVGPANRMAVDAISRVGIRSSDGLQMATLHGGCGIGKTHLLHAAVESQKATKAGATARLLTGETFVNEFLAGLRGKSTEAFRRSLRSVDLLCIDDVDFLANKTASQAELQHTIDAVTSRGGSVLMTSSVHPSKLTNFSPALISRLSGGLCVAVLPPDDQTLQRLVRVLAARRGLVVEEQAIPTVMAAASPAGKAVNIRELEGVLTKLDAISRLLDTAPARESRGAAGGQAGSGQGSSSTSGTSGTSGHFTSEFTGHFTGQRAVGLVAVQKALGQSAPRDTRRAVRMEEIVRTVCFELSVSSGELGASGRHPRVVLSRALCTALARRLTDQSYPEIARAIGRPNHSTVITAHQRLTGQIAACLTMDAGPRHGVLEVGLLLERLARMLQG